MKYNIKTSYYLLLILFLSSQPFRGQNDDSADKHSLRSDLQMIKGKGILFGHQDDLAYGVGWEYIRGESDVKRVSGDYPALFGWELGGIERGDQVNLDKVPFDTMRDLTIMGDQMGGINTFSWHPYAATKGESSWDKEAIVVEHIIPGGSHHEAFKQHLDKVASFFNQLKDKNGQDIPFIFRPWHEMDGSWFWWGDASCTKEEFKTLFEFTIQYLKEEKGLDQMLVAYSPDRNFDSENDYLQWYPGDKYVDILGVDNYGDLKQESDVEQAIKKLHIVIELANKKEKIAAFTETGIENVTDEKWYTQRLGKVLADPIIAKEISYVMVWRNDGNVHYFFPYPGQKGEADAKELLSDPHILLLEDFNSLQ
ncbi:glycosyl hydrolase [Lutimonas halocynthiae]|uniref:glycoside hydrolase family 26 protein n=1 Tax=Lutimonas halocynthiae TaxID=1446477 RepID=UPI0025B45A7D|nr:glycosyl hydrolase [Lutimonas halocynthiae]MDN3642258.1 glycosyl hydrolase [Lutimonas halocynthiae]